MHDDDLPLADGPRFPAGTPEYEAYRAELTRELDRWVAGEAPYYPEPLAPQARDEQRRHYAALGINVLPNPLG